ncbi:unnamed protein product [Rhizoctonia solani]|uniref:NACHT domain-containing protein n=1 Tax=Rhizoctonia solani TaxID=456999 RepID=A0A8H2X0W3_9AGAM|nr:unnamed protein product [Rhizoctonia solani]
MDPPSRKRVKQPLELIRNSLKRAKHEGNLESSASSSNGALPHTSSHVNEQSYKVSFVDSHLENLLEPPSAMEEDLAEVTEPGSSIPTTGFQATELVNLSSVEQPAPEQTHQGPPSQASTKKGLKRTVTVLTGQAADLLKIGPLKDVSDLLQGFADMCIADRAVKNEYEALRQRLQGLLRVLEEHSNMGESLEMVSKITGIREFIERELGFLGYQQRGEQHRFLLGAQKKEDNFLACCRRIQAYMDRLALDTYLSMWNIEEQYSRDRSLSWINRLPSAPSAWYDSSVGEDLKRRECTPGTRIDVLANLLGWAGNNDTEAVYWLNGMAGTGKTTIAYSVCKELAHSHKLAASFFCSRLRDECRDVKMIIPSIAYQLAQSSPPFQSALSTIIENNQDAHHRVLDEQFEALIRKPLLAVIATGSLEPGRVIVVIDALDECENKDSTRAILGVLLNKSVDLPIRFIVSSRPEPQIRDKMTDDRVKARLVLHELDTGNVQIDIKTYLQEELKQMKPPPESAQIDALVEQAGILFIYAATAVRYIGYDNFRRNPKARMRTLLDRSQSEGTKKTQEIDQLYAAILEAGLGDPALEQHEQHDMRQVLFTVICAREPVTVEGLSELLQMEDVERVRVALRPFWSVLHVVGLNELVTTLHASFPDFMFDLSRSGAYHCSSEAHNGKLAVHCFERIKRAQPQFNICGLESSYLRDENIPNIEERAAKAIPPELLYACRFWADHIDTGECASVLAKPLKDFLSTRLLLWMEILNVNRQMKAGTECMKIIIKWCDKLEAHRELFELAHDAKKFVEAFALNPISQSTPHIYMSMLAFWPGSAPISKYYAKYTHGPVKAEGTALDRRQLAHLATWAFDKKIEAMAMSPDGLYIALAIGSGVLVVDSSSGRVVAEPLTGHEDTTSSITFSSDGTCLVAGYIDHKDAKILRWDTHTSTGYTMLHPLLLKGHTRSVNCLCFSLDGARIATGSDDKTVRVWDTENGKLLLCLATEVPIYAVAFSPDGTRISAKSSQTLYVWDSRTGDTTLGPLTRPNHIDIMTFSPKNLPIICDCDNSPNGIIYVLNAHSGDVIPGPLTGYQAEITCIGCSPNGSYIVSGSDDRTVCVWDVQNGNMVLGPLEAHTGEITSVTFSADGSHIISACLGGLVCTWDARQRNLTSSSDRAPLDPITSVNFSSDGTRFVSGSEFGTICIWDALTGEMVVGPIRAHTSRINAVHFSNDHIVSGSEDGKICICNALTEEAVLDRLELHPGTRVRAIAYSPNGKHIATGSGNEIDLWDAQTGSRALGPLTGLQGSVASIQFSPDGTRIVGSSWESRENIVVWDVSDGKSLFGSLDGHHNWVFSVSYSPNGALIASGSGDKTIIIWDAYTGKKALGPLTGHSSYVRSVDFSPDSTRLVSGSSDRTIRIWDIQTGEMVFKLPNGHENRIRSVAYSPDGTRILSLSRDMCTRVHDARSPEEMAWSRSESEVSDWTIKKDGWVVDEEGGLLVWVPGDLRKVLMWPRTELLVAPPGYVRLRFDKPHMGKFWGKCFASN